MTTKSIPTIDPGRVAKRRGAQGEGIIIAVVGSGIDVRHPHFARNANLTLPPGLQHCDLTLLRGRKDLSPNQAAPSKEAVATLLSTLDDELLQTEALIDRQGYTTHLAAIIAGYIEKSDVGSDWDEEESSMAGVAPKCKLLSLKVLDDEGRGDERDVLRALDMVLALNARAGAIVVHGAIVPFSMAHDATNYACGRTPVCTAVDRLVDAGVVVIAPSGNRGYLKVESFGELTGVAGVATITDPGNAEKAITVGATHRFRPLEYGASYFSSRGPTLDGRMKPDLLAPGERILSAIPTPALSTEVQKKGKRSKTAKEEPVPKRSDAQYQRRDGTSMAAAHVAGAVAVLLSARPDLIGYPERVKELLLSTATDLGRAPQFQGHGLLNLSRALGEKATIVSPAVGVEPVTAAIHAPAQIVVPDTQRPAPAPAKVGGKRFAVAFSFQGIHREYVKQVVYGVRNSKNVVLSRDEIFYDQFHLAELSRPDLDVYLQDVYGKHSELVVVFLGAGYDTNEWCGGVEWRAIRDLIKRGANGLVMPVRLDSVSIEGLLSIDGYLSAERREPEEVADLVLKRLQLNRGNRN
jgi:subtilisin family serine protease